MHKPADGKDPQHRPEIRDGIRIDWDMPIPIEDGVVLRCTTGYMRDAIVHHGVLDPDVHVVIKPYSLEVLSAKLHELLRERTVPSES